MKLNNIIIGGLVIAIVIMGIAFAAFSTTLNISGTATISSTWKIDFEDAGCHYYSTNMTGLDDVPSAEYGYIEGNISVEVSGTTATITADMIAPGDYASCQIEAINNGTLSAKLNSFETIVPDGANEYYVIEAFLEPMDGETIFSIDEAKAKYPDDLDPEALIQHTLVVNITYKEDVTEKPTDPVTFKAIANYQQAV